MDPPDASANVEIVVEPAESGVRIDRFLGHRFHPVWSRSFITDQIAAGQILVGGRPVRPAYRIQPGDRISAVLEPRTESSPRPEDIPLDVAFEDEHVLLVRKPAGMVVHPGPSCGSGTLVNALLHRNPEIAKVGVVDRPGIVHRLDAQTSGIMVLAKTNEARAHLVDQFKTKQVRKEYRAICVNVMPFDSDYVDLPIGEDARHKDRMCVDAAAGKPSSTWYQVIERLTAAGSIGGATYVKAMPFTGRTHQIRVHLAHIGFPVFADPVYGRQYAQRSEQLKKERARAGLPPLIQRHALHAHRIRLLHPATNVEMEFEAPLPSDMQALLETLRAGRERA